jgi:hypothetical protein
MVSLGTDRMAFSEVELTGGIRAVEALEVVRAPGK